MGNKKMTIDRLTKLEREYVNSVLDTEFRGSKNIGMVARVENAFSKFFEKEFSIGFVNGTATLHTALESLGVGPGDEVIVPPLTMSSTAFSVLQANATPIFADVDPNTFQIDSKSIANRITKKTKAIMTVALYGGSPDYDSIQEISNGLPLIEDNAQALGTKYKGVEIGSFGVFSSYSFQASKHLTSGEGGMLCTNSLAMADYARKIQCLGYSSVGASNNRVKKEDIQDPYYSRHEILGWNYRMSELTAAVILGQIERADALIAQRKEFGRKLFQIVSQTNWLQPQKIVDNSEHSFWAAAVLMNHESISWHQFRDKFLELGGKGIYAAWKLSYLEPAFQNMKLMGRERLIDKEISDLYKTGYCQNAEFIEETCLLVKSNKSITSYDCCKTKYCLKRIIFI